MAIFVFPCSSRLRTAAPYQLPLLSQSQSYVTTDGQSASLSWNKAPIWGLRPDLCYCLAFAGLFMWGALSDKRTGLTFTITAGPRQRNHFRVWVPWHSWPYFTVSVSRLPFSSPPIAALRWRYSTSPPHGILPLLASIILLITLLHGPSWKHRFQQYLYCCMRIHYLETGRPATILCQHTT
jgi:hypothetical protein